MSGRTEDQDSEYASLATNCEWTICGNVSDYNCSLGRSSLIMRVFMFRVMGGQTTPLRIVLLSQYCSIACYSVPSSPQSEDAAIRNPLQSTSTKWDLQKQPLFLAIAGSPWGRPAAEEMHADSSATTDRSARGPIRMQRRPPGCDHLPGYWLFACHIFPRIRDMHPQLPERP